MRVQDAARDPKSDRAAAAAASQMVNANSRKCLAVPGGSTAAGTGLIQWPCGTWADHFWTAEPWSINGAVYYRFVNANSGQCLALPGGSTKDGAQVIQWPCGTWGDHFWGLFIDGNGFHLVNYNSGQCLGIAGGSVADGAKVIQWPCGTWADHRWYV
ncbi:RICIN domain-containing protein [Streptomyces sp. ID05-47C]|uniref:RICIN domain-containing protein n=1 Tax=Streptomyces sp. ID05-47C TaxID=3028665 RepID=UPI0029AB3328|nr:RICIN domain-containing protein [Streptomyces sp. ID05-47C]MDX3569048.1 RICIN domain-containing protein [Streptomyces sp. ID05-47C]